MGAPDLSAGPQHLSLKCGFSPQSPPCHNTPSPRNRSAGPGSSRAGLNATSPLHPAAWAPESSILTRIAAVSRDGGYIRLIPPQKNGPLEGRAVSLPAVSPPGSNKHMGVGARCERMDESLPVNCSSLDSGVKPTSSARCSLGSREASLQGVPRAPLPPFLSFRPRLHAGQFPE